MTLRWSLRDSRAGSEAARAHLRERLSAKLTRVGAIVVHADEYRSRARNREAARARLAAMVKEGLARPRPRRETRQPRGARERELAGKKRRSDVKRGRGRVKRED